jgi:hypothetical protein
MKKTLFLTALVVSYLFTIAHGLSAARAQAMATPTSPALCFPATPMAVWQCVDGTAVAVVDTPTPTLGPTMTLAPTSPPQPTATPGPYPGPNPYPGPLQVQEITPKPVFHLYLPVLR